MQELENEEVEKFSPPHFGIFGDEKEQKEPETELETVEDEDETEPETVAKQPETLETVVKQGETIVFKADRGVVEAKQNSLKFAKQQQVQLVVSGEDETEEEEFPGDDRLSPAMLKQLKDRLTKLKGKARSYASRGNKYEERALACAEGSDERLELSKRFQSAMLEAQKAKAEAKQLEKEIALQEKYMN